jgi:hypothetical protein
VNLPPSTILQPVIAHSAPRWLRTIERVRRPIPLMLAWGIAIGLLGALALLILSPHNWPIIGSRASDLRASLSMLEHGGPLLLGRHGATGSLYAVGVSDDQGIYVYLPLLSRLLGVSDPVQTLRWSYAVLFGLGAAIYPVIFFKLTRSLLAGLLAPLMLLACAVSLGFDDIYWIPAWGYLTVLPLLLLLTVSWPRFGFVALLGIALAASWLTSIRSQSGLPIVIAAAGVLLLHRYRWWRTLPALALLAVAYISIGTFVIGAIRDHRDHRIGTTALDRGLPTSHPFWHPAYLGLGYLPNAYGIRFKDSIAIARVEREAPGTAYLSTRYEATLRKAFFSLLTHDPLMVAKQYAAKVLVTAADTFLYVWPALLIMPAMLLAGAERRIRRRWAALMLPALIVSFLPSVFAIPEQVYEEGLYGTVGLAAILAICWALGRVEVAARQSGGLRPALAMLAGVWADERTGRGPLWRSARISAIALATMLALVVSGHFIRRDAERWQGASSGVLIDELHTSPNSVTST